MGQPAARMGDAAGHGGAIVFGTPTVLIGGMPAARIGDPLACPGADGPKPHVMGNITTASATVMIAGAFAARQGDTTGCGAAGVSGAGAPAAAGPSGPEGAFNREGTLYGDPNAGFGYGSASGYVNSRGAGVQGKVSGERIAGTTTFADGSSASGSADGLTAQGEAHIGAGSIGASVQGAVVTGQGKLTDAKGNSVGAQGSLLTAQAGTDILLGTDGRRTGIGLGGALQASLAEGQIDTVDVYHIPFTDYTMNVGGTVGGSLGSVGAAANVGAFHDAADNRVHFAGMIDIEAVIGAKLGLDISFGRAASAGGGGGTPGVPVPLTPGTVIIGCPTVLIG